MLFQLTANGLFDVRVSFSGKYRVKLTGYYVNDNINVNARFRYFSSRILGLYKLALNTLPNHGCFSAPIDLGVIQIDNIIDTKVDDPTGSVLSYVILDFDIEPVL